MVQTISNGEDVGLNSKWEWYAATVVFDMVWTGCRDGEMVTGVQNAVSGLDTEIHFEVVKQWR